MTEFIRRFNGTGMELGVEQHDDGENRAWFVMDRSRGREKWDVEWHTHCGPYSTREQAVDWIMAIREDGHILRHILRLDERAKGST